MLAKSLREHCIDGREEKKKKEKEGIALCLISEFGAGKQKKKKS